MVAEPAETPVTVPVEGTTNAIDVLLLLHAPPGVASLNVIVVPAQTLVKPLTGVEIKDVNIAKKASVFPLLTIWYAAGVAMADVLRVLPDRNVFPALSVATD